MAGAYYNYVPLFHVKHTLLTNAEIPEHDVQHFIHFNPSGDPTQSPRRHAHIFRHQFDGFVFLSRSFQRTHAFL